MSYTVPGPVVNLEVLPISASTLRVSWQPPTVTNGTIVLYSITAYDGTTLVHDTTVDGGSTSTININSLGRVWSLRNRYGFMVPTSVTTERYVPYLVSVRAHTSAGFGFTAEVVTFTEEGGMLYCS